MRKALILSYVALVATVLFVPGPGRSQDRERLVIREVMGGGDQRIVLRDGEFVSLRADSSDRMYERRAWRRFDRIDRLRDLRELRGLRRLDRFERLGELRGLRCLERLDRFERSSRIRRFDRDRDRDRWF